MLHYINMLHSHPHRETELEALSHWRLRDQAELDSSQIGVTHSAAVTRKPYCPQGSGVTQQKRGRQAGPGRLWAAQITLWSSWLQADLQKAPCNLPATSCSEPHWA